jgi:MFS_1 like family
MMLGAFFTLFLRMALYILLPIFVDVQRFTWLAIVIEPLHGLAFALSWASGLAHVSNLAPNTIEEPFWISVFYTAYKNIGGILGNLLGSAVVGYGYQYVFIAGCISCIFGALFFYLSLWMGKKRIQSFQIPA